MRERSGGLITQALVERELDQPPRDEGLAEALPALRLTDLPQDRVEGLLLDRALLAQEAQVKALPAELIAATRVAIHPLAQRRFARQLRKELVARVDRVEDLAGSGRIEEG